MKLRHVLFSSLLLAPLLAVAMPAMAQTAPPEPKVHFDLKADMGTLRGEDLDNFEFTLTDVQVTTSGTIKCRAAKKGFLGAGKQARECGLTALGSLMSNGKVAGPRADYSGIYKVEDDGTTEMSPLLVNYRKFGKVDPSSSGFKGVLGLKTSVVDGKFLQFKDLVLDKIGQGDPALANTATDFVDMKGFTVPSAGRPSDAGVKLEGDWLYTYGNTTWFTDFVGTTYTNVTTNGTTNVVTADYPLVGNMAWVEGENNQATYFLTLSAPSGENSDDALFAGGDSDDDLFAAVTGIQAALVMDQSSFQTVSIGGVDIEAASKMTVSGDFTGTDVPLELVRAIAYFIALAPQTYFGP